MNNVITAQFLQRYPSECAREIEHFSLDDILSFIGPLPIKDATRILSHVLPTVAAVCLHKLPVHHAQEIIKRMPMQTLKMIMPRINLDLREQLIACLPKNQQIALQHSLSFSMQTVGAFMSTQVLFLSSDQIISETRALLCAYAEEITPILFCIDGSGKLQGMVSLKDLMCTASDVSLNHIMQACPLVLPTNTAIQSIVTHSIWSKYSVLPVVDEDEVLVGALEFEKIISTLQDFLFNQRKENLFESLSHIMLMLTHTTEDILNEINEWVPPEDEDK